MIEVTAIDEGAGAGIRFQRQVETQGLDTG